MIGDKSSTESILYPTILVTGCGGDIGMGIGRILKMSEVCERVIGCDVHKDHPGIFIFDECEVVQGADSENFLETISETIIRHSVDLIIPTSEPELRFLYNKNLLSLIANVPVLVPNEKAMTVGLDKLKTADFLKSINLPYPWTKVVKEGIPAELPCIIKSRYGSGSRDVQLVHEETAEGFFRRRPEHIWQEYLQPDTQEYTCGLYRSKDGNIRTIIFKRQLKYGVTAFGEVAENADITNVLCKIAEALELCGSINVQLRLTDRGPVVFEINSRFSSTVVFRHMLGFEDLIWSLTEKGGGALKPYKPQPPGAKIYRSSQEIICDRKGAENQ